MTYKKGCVVHSKSIIIHTMPYIIGQVHGAVLDIANFISQNFSYTAQPLIIRIC